METDDFKGFIKYLSSLWGALGSITVVFPLVDVLFKVIPLPVDSYGKSTAPIVIPITSLVALFMCAFAILALMEFRHRRTRTKA